MTLPALLVKLLRREDLSTEEAPAARDALLDGLRARGRRVITPSDPAQRAGNVCFLADDAADPG